MRIYLNVYEAIVKVITPDLGTHKGKSKYRRVLLKHSIASE